MIDDSSRIGRSGFEKAKNNVKTMLEWFTIDPNGTNVAAMTFSDTENLQLPFPFPGTNSPPQTLFDIQGRIESLSYSGGSKSYLDKALELAAARVFPENSNTVRKSSKKVSKNYLSILVDFYLKTTILRDTEFQIVSKIPSF